MGVFVFVVGAIALTFLVGSLVGYAIHWLLHQRWSGVLYRSHMNHHLKQYPPKRLLSDVYRSSGADSGWLVFTPFVAGYVFLTVWVLSWFGVPWWVHAILITETAVVGYLHGYVHDGLHVRGHLLEKVPGFEKLRALHAAHHRNMRKNLGIFWFGWDRVLGTFSNNRDDKR